MILFSTEENRQEEQREQVQQIPIDELHPFTNHPFQGAGNVEAMTRTVESIAQYGVLAPLIARPRPDGDGYEIILPAPPPVCSETCRAGYSAGHCAADVGRCCCDIDGGQQPSA